MCFDIDYNPGEAGSLALYQDLYDAGLKIWHFSGNTDGAVPTAGTRTWIYQTGWPVLHDWQPYFIKNKQVGGYAEV